MPSATVRLWSLAEGRSMLWSQPQERRGRQVSCAELVERPVILCWPSALCQDRLRIKTRQSQVSDYAPGPSNDQKITFSTEQLSFCGHLITEQWILSAVYQHKEI